ncbi:MAG: hypothetical protein ACRDAG_11345 [Cetobacterium somerae]|uniref:hypothetical protein n=1 Tax=Cetobacterium somerae TaxID=188913 RepID=UPI003F31F701
MKEIIKVDILTWVYNHNYFNDIVKINYEERKEGYLILIDLDDLRKLGEALKEFSNIQFFRIGGDEFVGITDISKSKLEIT